jgi:hypothetical protein
MSLGQQQTTTVLAGVMVMMSLLSFPSLASESPNHESSLRDREEEVRRAVLQADSDALAALWSHRFVATTPRVGIAPHRQGVLEAMDQGRIAYSEYQQTIELIRVDGDTAIVMGSENVRTDPGNDPVQRRFTHVWILRDDTWLLLARRAHLLDP